MDDALKEMTTKVVTAYVGNNAVLATDLPALINGVYGALTNLGKPVAPTEPVKAPAVPIKKSVTPDYIICLEDGKKLKMLKRHLHSVYGLSPDEYRAKWGLPHDYPMVAPHYAQARSAMALKIGLGRKKEEPPAPAEPAAKGKTRRKKATA
ncbi:MucR family transcriptional regulator [Azospirillum canadense]|uniref:MucR family transcriptional regulator n=1 Tax=Azospirillum canadense TaxID=403962 RepID=UPI0022273DFD|nr:MucR family transcriptional regulator [Azospirillum canadense]MCW2240631.1 putative transcriptional regulator [Azospirillum canadense]